MPSPRRSPRAPTASAAAVAVARRRRRPGRSCGRGWPTTPAAASRAAGARKVTLPPLGGGGGEIAGGVPAAAPLPLERGARDALADHQHVRQVQRQVPARVVLPVPVDR